MNEPSDPLIDRLTDRLEQLADSAQAHRNLDRVMTAAPPTQARATTTHLWGRGAVQIAAGAIVLAGVGAIVTVAAVQDAPTSQAPTSIPAADASNCTPTPDSEGGTTSLADQDEIGVPPLEQLDDAQRECVDQILSAFVETNLPGWSIGAELEGGFDEAGELSGAVALLRTDEPFTGQLRFPAIERGTDPDGSEAWTAYEVSYSVEAVSEVSVAVDFELGVLFATPEFSRGGEYVSSEEVGERRRLDGADKPLPIPNKDH